MRILTAVSTRPSRSISTAAILFLLFSPFALGAQGSSIRGQVTDPQGGLVAGARVTVYVRDGSWRLVATTDRSGSYSLETPPAIEYLAEAEAPGLARSATQVIRAGADGQVSADFQLGLGVVAENIVVTASGMPQPVEEVSKSVSTLSNRQMEDRAESSLVE